MTDSSVSPATGPAATPSEQANDHTYKFNITMTCSGCSGAVERVLSRLDGVNEYNVSLDSQSAEVHTSDAVTYDMLLEKIKKTGKKVNSGEMDGKGMAV